MSLSLCLVMLCTVSKHTGTRSSDDMRGTRHRQEEKRGETEGIIPHWFALCAQAFTGRLEITSPWASLVSM